jgi:uncharacterized protein YpbB
VIDSLIHEIISVSNHSHESITFAPINKINAIIASIKRNIPWIASHIKRYQQKESLETRRNDYQEYYAHTASE